jgi:hypothetical protein
MKYKIDLHEIADREYDALLMQSIKPEPEDFEEWYEKAFLRSVYLELKDELEIFNVPKE